MKWVYVDASTQSQIFLICALRPEISWGLALIGNAYNLCLIFYQTIVRITIELPSKSFSGKMLISYYI